MELECGSRERRQRIIAGKSEGRNKKKKRQKKRNKKKKKKRIEPDGSSAGADFLLFKDLPVGSLRLFFVGVFTWFSSGALQERELGSIKPDENPTKNPVEEPAATTVPPLCSRKAEKNSIELGWNAIEPDRIEGGTLVIRRKTRWGIETTTEKPEETRCRQVCVRRRKGHDPSRNGPVLREKPATEPDGDRKTQ